MDINQLPASPAAPQTQQPQPNNPPGSEGRSKPDGVPVSGPNSVPSAKTQGVAPPIDKVCWRSEDGLVVIKQLVKLAHKHPPSDYPCVVLQGFPRETQRIRRIHGGGIELMLTFQEADQFVRALNAAAESEGKGTVYAILQSIPPKPEWRKKKWKKLNEDLFAKNRLRGSTQRWQSAQENRKKR